MSEFDWWWFPHDPWPTCKFEKHHGSHKLLLCVVVDDHDSVAAYFAYRMRKRAVELVRLVVHEHYRRCRVGWSVLRRIQEIARRYSLPSVFAEVPDALLPQAHRWLLACGWHQGNRSHCDGEHFTTFQLPVLRPATVGV
jgi:N-acetylglutamate synthase-like GNAT family acetyltransferase